jgi:glucose/arabinose dehydrogenase
MLLVSNGETHETERAQDPGQPGGKVLRFTPDGEPGPGGPFPGSAALSIGHRNPFGLTIDPISGAPWVSENGPDAFDEINRIEAGGNYGWPLVAGPGCDEIDVERCVEPAASYEEIIVPTGLAFAPRNAPAGVAGHLFFGTYGGGIHELTLDEQRREVVADELLPNSDESIVAVAWGPEGLYYSTPVALKVIPYGTAEGKGDGAASPPPSSAKPQSGGAEGRGTVGFAVVLVLLVGLFAASRRRLFR